MRVVAAILAAGASRRLGRPKQLLPYAGGTLLGTITHRVCASVCVDVAVVLGAHADEVAPALAGHPVVIVRNEAWPEGIASSIRRAVGWARATASTALVLCVADQPRLSTAHVDALVSRHRMHGGAVASHYAGVLAVPALFPARCYTHLASLTGDRGARAVIVEAQADAVDWPDGLVDIDAPSDAARL